MMRTTPTSRQPAALSSTTFARMLLHVLNNYYADVFGNGRNAYAIPRNALSDATQQRQMSAFFWWTAWAATTNRPGQRRQLYAELAA